MDVHSHSDARFVFNTPSTQESANELALSQDGFAPIPKHHAKRFQYAPKHILEDALGSITSEQWNDWRWQQRKRFRHISQLEKVLTLTQEEKTAFKRTDALFHMAITPYYASLMDKDDPNCPIRLQSVPHNAELDILPEDLADPLGEEKDMPVPGSPIVTQIGCCFIQPTIALFTAGIAPVNGRSATLLQWLTKIR